MFRFHVHDDRVMCPYNRGVVRQSSYKRVLHKIFCIFYNTVTLFSCLFLVFDDKFVLAIQYNSSMQKLFCPVSFRDDSWIAPVSSTHA